LAAMATAPGMKPHRPAPLIARCAVIISARAAKPLQAVQQIATLLHRPATSTQTVKQANPKQPAHRIVRLLPVEMEHVMLEKVKRADRGVRRIVMAHAAT